MTHISNTLTAQNASETQVIAYLKNHHINLHFGLDKPPEYIRLLCQHWDDTGDWATVGRSKAASSISMFWLNALDLEHLKGLVHEPIKPVVNRMTWVDNRFATLQIDDCERPSRQYVSDRDFDTWPLLFGDSALDTKEREDGKIDSDPRKQPDGHVNSDNGLSTDFVLTTPKDRPIREILQEKHAFLKTCGLSAVPLIASDDRPLDLLLVTDDLLGLVTVGTEAVG